MVKLLNNCHSISKPGGAVPRIQPSHFLIARSFAGPRAVHARAAASLFRRAQLCEAARGARAQSREFGRAGVVGQVRAARLQAGAVRCHLGGALKQHSRE